MNLVCVWVCVGGVLLSLERLQSRAFSPHVWMLEDLGIVSHSLDQKPEVGGQKSEQEIFRCTTFPHFVRAPCWPSPTALLTPVSFTPDQPALPAGAASSFSLWTCSHYSLEKGPGPLIWLQ